MLEELDKNLLERFTKFCHWFQRMTGRTNFFLAKIVVWLLACSTIVSVVNYYYRVLVNETDLLSCVISIILTPLFLRDAYLCDKSEGDSLSTTKAKRRYTADFEWLRKYLVFLIIFIVPAMISNLMESHFNPLQFLKEFYFWGIFLFSYLANVDPLPPGKSKVREFAESLIARFQGNPQTVGAKA